MATAAKRNGTDRADESAIDGGSAPSVAGMGELAQRQLVASAEAMSQLFARYETMQRAQLQVAERAALLHRQAADNLRKATTPYELAAIQGTLFMYQYQEATRFWQEWLGAAGRMRADAAASLPGSGSSTADATPSSTAAAAVGAAMNVAAPMAEAFQQMFMAPLNAANQAH